MHVCGGSFVLLARRVGSECTLKQFWEGGATFDDRNISIRKRHKGGRPNWEECEALGKVALKKKGVQGGQSHKRRLYYQMTN